MGLYQRGKNKVWWMSFICKGRQVRRSTETSNRRLAEKIYAKVQTEVVEGTWFDRLLGETKTFRELMEKYLSEHSLPNKAPHSYKTDTCLAKRLIKIFGKLTLTEVTPRLISEYKCMRRKAGARPATINHELKLMGHAFKLAMNEWEWVNVNPVKKVSMEKVSNYIERWLTAEEERRLLGASPDWLKEIILFAIHTGLRQSEIFGLRWPMVDLERKTLTILVQKNGGRDTLPVNETVLKVFKARSKVRRRGTDLVFFSGAGTRLDAANVRRDFYGAVKKSGITKLRFHDLRHTFATRLAQAGVDMYMIQRLGRWKTTAMVMRYAHHYPESLRPGVAVLDKSITILSHSADEQEKRDCEDSATP